MADKYNFLNFTVLDFETTGLDAKVDQIIEASVIRVRDGNPVMTFNALVALREGTKVPKAITDQTGHAEADLIGAMSEHDLGYTLSCLIPADELIVAHNALFDMEFLNVLFQTTGVIEGDDNIDNPFIDSLTIARDREPYPHKLAYCCKRNGIILDDAHSAEADTLALMELIIKYHKDKDISEYVNVAGYRAKYGEPSWYPEGTKLKKQGAEHVNHSKPKPRGAVGVKSQTAMTSNRKKKTPPPGDSAEDLP